MRGRTLSTIHWKKYLDPTENTRVRNFLNHRGDDVLWQISLNIHKAATSSQHLKDKIVIVVHENAPNAIVIEKKDYQNVLDLALNWFVSREQYEKCADISKFKKDISSFRKIKNRDKTIKNLI